MAKRLEQVKDSQPKRLQGIKFVIQTNQDVVQQSVVEVTDDKLYDIQRNRAPHPGGPLDPRLGVSSKKGKCDTCFLPLQECPGHFGHVRLPLPVFHIGYFRFVLAILKNICKTCSSILLREDDKRLYLHNLKKPNIAFFRRTSILDQISAKCILAKTCPKCGSLNGIVKKAGPLKIAHDRFAVFHRSTAREKVVLNEMKLFERSFGEAIKENPEVAKHQGKALDDLTPLRVLNLLKRVSPTDCELLGLDPYEGRPEMFLWQYLPVSPIAIRPSIPQQDKSSTNEDDLTTKLAEIVAVCGNIREGLKNGTSVSVIMQQWEFLQFQVAMYIDSGSSMGAAARQAKPIRAFAQRLKGKQGRFRKCLTGKRVDYCGRSVISPDPNLSVDEVGVPRLMAMQLTFPERVNRINLESLRKLVVSGPNHWPGANVVIFQGEDGYKHDLKFGDRVAAARRLEIGDIVERHIHNGDIALFNRQPSLHKLSIMAHTVKVHNSRTLRLNECVCGPYGADFDGDEMNLFIPQTQEARAEALTLMGVKENIVTTKNGEPVIAAIQDFITAAYLISCKDQFFSRQQFAQLYAHMTGSTECLDLPPPSIIKPQMLWTGKQIFNVLLRPNRESPVQINLEAKCKAFTNPSSEPFDMDPEDNYLVIHNSEVMCGRMDKSTIGAGTKSSMFYTILRDYGQDEAIAAMYRLTRLCARFITNRGVSLGVFDVHPVDSLQENKEQLVSLANIQCDNLVRLFNTGKLQNSPGCDLDQTLEHAISGVLSRVRSEAGDLCLQTLSKNNSPLTMATSGAKGLAINVAQMVALVGQQIIGGQRVSNGFSDRSLPHFPKHSRQPASRGFVQNSFYSGLLPTEFFFHAMSGREGIVDTSVKTSSAGYMSRRLVKLLEDLSTQYDDTVRTQGGEIIQFQYGGDNLEPSAMEGSDKPVNFDHVWRHAQNVARGRVGSFLGPEAAMELCSSMLLDEDKRLSKQPNVGGYIADARYLSELYDYVADRVSKARVAQPGAEDMELDDVPPAAEISSVALETFIKLCLCKFQKAHVEPGSPIGMAASHSIGEPGTQMALKTFHFAGVAGMNVTEGIPRVEEIINAPKKRIATPVITCPLINAEDISAARDAQGRIEKICLGDVLEYMEEEWCSTEANIILKVDEGAFLNLHLPLCLFDVASMLLVDKRLKLGRVIFNSKTRTLRIPSVSVAKSRSKNPVTDEKSETEDVGRRIAFLKTALPKVQISGCPDAKRAVIQTEAGKNTVYVEGYGLQRCINTDGVVGTKVTTNFVAECYSILGIEAARKTIVTELQKVMSEMNVDPRHLELLADTMTFTGKVLGATRFGMRLMHDSVLRMAAFEQTTDHLFEAATKLKTDSIRGVTESVITGQTMRLGTGAVGMVRPLGIDTSQLGALPTVFEDAWALQLGKRDREGEAEDSKEGKRRKLMRGPN